MKLQNQYQRRNSCLERNSRIKNVRLRKKVMQLNVFSTPVSNMSSELYNMPFILQSLNY